MWRGASGRWLAAHEKRRAAVDKWRVSPPRTAGAFRDFCNLMYMEGTAATSSRRWQTAGPPRSRLEQHKGEKDRQTAAPARPSAAPRFPAVHHSEGGRGWGKKERDETRGRANERERVRRVSRIWDDGDGTGITAASSDMDI